MFVLLRPQSWGALISASLSRVAWFSEFGNHQRRRHALLLGFCKKQKAKESLQGASLQDLPAAQIKTECDANGQVPSAEVESVGAVTGVSWKVARV